MNVHPCSLQHENYYRDTFAFLLSIYLKVLYSRLVCVPRLVHKIVCKYATYLFLDINVFSDVNRITLSSDIIVVSRM